MDSILSQMEKNGNRMNLSESTVIMTKWSLTDLVWTGETVTELHKFHGELFIWVSAFRMEELLYLNHEYYVD